MRSEPSRPVAEPVSTVPVARPFYVLAGLGFVGLAILGAFLPLLPTTVFGICAAACFSRSSPRLEAWLLDHPVLGPPIRAWRERGAIRPRAKALAVGGMTLSGVLTAATAPPLVAIGVAVALLASAAFVLSRPDR